MKKRIIITIIIIIILFLGGFASLIFFGKKNNKIDCVDSTKEFLVWYKQNLETIDKLENNITKKGNNGYYRVDFENEKQFILLLKSSGFVSNEFLSKLDIYVKNSDKYLEEIKQNDGPPEGFDFDLIFLAQDYHYVLEKIPNIIIKINNGDGKDILVDKRFHFLFDSNCKIIDNDISKYITQ